MMLRNKIILYSCNQASTVVRRGFHPGGFGAVFNIWRRFIQPFSAYWGDLERARKDEENEPYLSSLAQTVQK
jgi:hypothetical protein